MIFKPFWTVLLLVFSLLLLGIMLNILVAYFIKKRFSLLVTDIVIWHGDDLNILWKIVK